MPQGSTLLSLTANVRNQAGKIVKGKKSITQKTDEVISIAQIYQKVNISVSELFKRSRNNVLFLQMSKNFISVSVD